MTRYARAKGSKASNERTPGEPTPWHVMKQQLQDNANPKPPVIAKSAKELLQEPQRSSSLIDAQTNFSNDWAEIQVAGLEQRKTKLLDTAAVKNCKIGNDETLTSAAMNQASNTVKRRRNKVKAEKVQCKSSDNISGSTTNDATENQICALTKRQKRNIKKKIQMGQEDSKGLQSNQDHIDNVEGNRTNNHISNNSDENFASNAHLKHRFNQNYQKTFDTKKNERKRKPPKVRDVGGEHKRRKPDTGPVKITINGVDIEIIKYDGYPVKREDAERLEELKQKMIMKGIPKSEIDATMKLERRRAEKALARVKKCVCFHCRKAGHNLSDCPELSSEQSATGICFKCGSTEHTHFECKVAKASEYRYATCFICREQGHIAKQCPDNPKGVYPQGGACKLCGDVTHLKKDCPDLINKKEEDAITVDVITNADLEALDEGPAQKIRPEKNLKTVKQKVVKF